MLIFLMKNIEWRAMIQLPGSLFLMGLCLISGCDEKLDPIHTPPSVSTGVVSNITPNTATIAGEVTDQGSSTVSSRGFCIDVSTGPTLDDTSFPGGSGTGDFTVNLDDLDAATTYFVRAYGINETDTTYGNEVVFTTLEEVVPVVCENLPGVVYDYDCNPYDVIQIGDQFWLKQNLKTTHYRNGTAIPTGLTNEEWVATDQGAYAVYEDLQENDDIYGKLYNWFAVDNVNGLCPYGWHVPNLWEMVTLEVFLGGAGVASGKMKSVSNLWDAPNVASNTSGFSALPGGHRFFSTGTYGLKNINGTFWTSSTSSNGGGKSAYYYVLHHDNERLERPYLPKKGGYSCRCLKD